MIRCADFGTLRAHDIVRTRDGCGIRAARRFLALHFLVACHAVVICAAAMCGKRKFEAGGLLFR